MLFSTILLSLASLAFAAPTPKASPRALPGFTPAHVSPLFKRQSPVPLSQAQIDSFNPSTHLTSAAYCSLDTLRTWTCGPNCDAIPGFVTSLVGGDGAATPRFYVGFDPNSQQIVVGHQGTDPKKVKSLLVDADFFLDEMDPAFFPGLSKDIETHGGFQDAHARSANQILAAVRAEIANRGVNKVLCVGHSLGGALALLDGVFLTLQLGNQIDLRVITYGMPRVGNQEFADFVDANIELDRITNREDIVPILPGRFLGFRHPQGESHIDEESGVMVACPGQENNDERCAVKDVGNILIASIPDHHGPYNGITIGC